MGPALIKQYQNLKLLDLMLVSINQALDQRRMSDTAKLAIGGIVVAVLVLILLPALLILSFQRLEYYQVSVACAGERLINMDSYRNIVNESGLPDRSVIKDVTCL